MLTFVEPQLAGVLYAEVSQHGARALQHPARRDPAPRAGRAHHQAGRRGPDPQDLQFGAIDLPPDYRRRGLDSLLSEGLASDKMRFTLELREKQVRESALAAQAERERREIQAEAARASK